MSEAKSRRVRLAAVLAAMVSVPTASSAQWFQRVHERSRELTEAQLDDVGEVRAAAQALLRSGAAVDTLLAALQRPGRESLEPAIANELLTALVALGGRPVEDGLGELLLSGHSQVDLIARALAVLGTPTAMRFLRDALVRPDLMSATEAAIVSNGAIGIGPFLLPMLRGDNGQRSAIRLAGELRYAAAVPELVVLSQHDDAEIARSAIDALIRIGDVRGRQALVSEELIDERLRLRASLVLPTDRDVLVLALNREVSNDLRSALLVALASIDAEAAVMVMRSDLAAEDGAVRDTAREVLFAQTDLAFLPVMRELLESNDWRRESAHALARLAEGSGIRALVEALSDGSCALNQDLCDALVLASAQHGPATLLDAGVDLNTMLPASAEGDYLRHVAGIEVTQAAHSGPAEASWRALAVCHEESERVWQELDAARSARAAEPWLAALAVCPQRSDGRTAILLRARELGLWSLGALSAIHVPPGAAGDRELEGELRRSLWSTDARTRSHAAWALARRNRAGAVRVLADRLREETDAQVAAVISAGLRIHPPRDASLARVVRFLSENAASSSPTGDENLAFQFNSTTLDGIRFTLRFADGRTIPLYTLPRGRFFLTGLGEQELEAFTEQ